MAEALEEERGGGDQEADCHDRYAPEPAEARTVISERRVVDCEAHDLRADDRGHEWIGGVLIRDVDDAREHGNEEPHENPSRIRKPSMFRVMAPLMDRERHDLDSHQTHVEPEGTGDLAEGDADDRHPDELGEVVFHGHSEVKDLRKVACARGHDASRRMTVREKHLGVKHLSCRFEAFCY